MCYKIASNFAPNKETLFSICFQHVHFKFPMGSHQVSNMFLKFLECVPNNNLF